MLLVLGFCEGNFRRSVEEYQLRFPNRIVPNRQTFANVERRLRETGTFKTRNNRTGRPNLITPQEEEDILDTIEEEPEISTRRLSRQIGISKSSINRITRRQQLHPYHIQGVQELLPPDLDARVIFCHFILNRGIDFHKKIIFTDEACFTRRGVTNIHNNHVYSNANPHAIASRHFQHEFRINVWAGIVDHHLIGPVILPNRLNGENYLDFLRNTFPNLIEDLPLLLRHEMWFMHDGAPPHFSVNVRNYLDQEYPNQWIGRGNNCPQNWPPRSPDLNPCDFFLWGALKDKVYSSRVENRQELWNRIVQNCNQFREDVEMMRRVIFNFRKRINFCLRENGGHFEQFL